MNLSSEGFECTREDEWGGQRERECRVHRRIGGLCRSADETSCDEGGSVASRDSAFECKLSQLGQRMRRFDEVVEVRLRDGEAVEDEGAEEGEGRCEGMDEGVFGVLRIG
jgi:hypothetical protein